MPLSKTGTMGGAYLAQLPGRASGDPFQEAETAIPGDAVIGNSSNLFPIAQGSYALNKATAAAITLQAPTLVQSGTVINFYSNTAAAHVITATTLLNDGLTGAPHTTATFAAFPGASITLCASQGKWNVLGKNVVTIT